MVPASHFRTFGGYCTSLSELAHDLRSLLLCCIDDSFWVVVVDLPKPLLKLLTICNVDNFIESCRRWSRFQLPSVASLDVNPVYRMNAPWSSGGALGSRYVPVYGSSQLRSAQRNIIIGALGCAIMVCVITIVRMRLHWSDEDRRNLPRRANLGIAGDATFGDIWALESFL